MKMGKVSDSGTLGSPRVPKLNGLRRKDTKAVIDRRGLRV